MKSLSLNYIYSNYNGTNVVKLSWGEINHESSIFNDMKPLPCLRGPVLLQFKSMHRQCGQSTGILYYVKSACRVHKC